MTKNIHFSVLIKIGRKLHEFNFRQRTPDLYDADTANERGTRCYFKMVNDGGFWIIQGLDLPGWIIENETEIVDGMKKGEPS